MNWLWAGWIGLSAAASLAADPDLARYGDQNEAKGFSEGNPIIPALFADPSMAKFGDTYYLYATTDGFGWPTGRWVVWKSKDFVHWSFQGESFPEITGQQNWAPGVPVLRNGRYWLPYTFHGGEGRIAVADQPEGPFHDAFGKAIVNDIDSEFFMDDDGTPYFVWGRPIQSINRLKPDLSAVLEPRTRVDFHKGYVEGPFMFKRHGIYYMCGANLGYAEYRIIYSMGDKPTGPFRFPEDNFIVQPNPADHLWGTGHGNVLCLNDRDEWVVVYLRSRMGERVDPFMEGGNVYRQVCADRIAFRPDGTIQALGPTRSGVGLVAPTTEIGRNLALGKTATASSSLPLYPPGKAADGGFGTRWIVGAGETIVPTSETQPVLWRWTTVQPANDWMRPDFEAAAWREGKGGFGTSATPGAIVGTIWNTADIWLRRSFTLTVADLKRSLRFRLHHDEDLEVYLNGVLALKLGGFTSHYGPFAIESAALAALRPGENVLAAHCHQTTGGHFVDIGITAVEAPWWQVDLGAVQPVARTEISFNYPTEITPYQLVWSKDGAQWQTYADHRHDQIHESPKVDRKLVEARYLRVQFQTAEPAGIPAGLWEFKAFDKP